MNRLYLAGAAVLVITVLSFTSCTLYKSQVATSVKADIATKVVSEAVVQSKAQAIRDYRAQAKKAVALDAVRTSTEILRKKNAETETPAVVTADPWIGVFNDAVRRTNRVIADSVSMP